MVNASPRQDELKMLLDAGLNMRQARGAMGISKQAAYTLLAKLRRKGYIWPKEAL